MNDPMLDPDPAVREAYQENLNKMIQQAIDDDESNRRFFASRKSVGSTIVIGETGFGDGPHAVDTPQ